ncbi:MAG TPA: Glu/Leu/Phe/Val dehydrogenase [Dehalococcoidia bacterium]|nr:Glu/Leu/Phe/Val dehydrogenase [Dehalococcoidia bacterium]
MPEIFELADDLGPAKSIFVHEPRLGLKGLLVIDNVARGPSIGGLRIAPDVTVSECFRLARAMTLKNSAAGLAHGGGKSVIWGDPRMPSEQKEALLRAFAHALRNEPDYIFGPDMGSDESCMAWIKDEIGRAVGLPAALGGIPLDELGATGWGLLHAAEVAAPAAGFALDGARVVIQGFGAVGKHAARFLASRGAVLVGASDSRGAIIKESGLDVEELIAFKQYGASVCDFPGGRKASGDELLDLDCEIWLPAARPDVITVASADRLRAKLVLEGANIPLTAEAEESLHKRGVLCLPDFVANAGGVICAAMEYAGATQTAAFEAIEEKIRANVAAVLAATGQRGITPRSAALELAASGLRRAMSTRRFNIM